MYNGVPINCMPIGKHRGKRFTELTEGQLAYYCSQTYWMPQKYPDLHQSLRRELKERLMRGYVSEDEFNDEMFGDLI